MWDETVNILQDMFKNVWGDKDVVEVDHVMEVTVPVSSISIFVRQSLSVDHLMYETVTCQR